jgi:UDP-glucose 4-epimerase
MATSVLDLAQGIAALLGVEPNITHAPARPGEVRHSRANPGYLVAQTGYRPSTTLTQGLALTASTFMQQASVLAAQGKHN